MALSMRSMGSGGVQSDPDRPIVHFGSPEGAHFGTPESRAMADFASAHPNFVFAPSEGDQ